MKVTLQVHKNLLATQKSYVVWFMGNMNIMFMNHWQAIGQTNDSTQAPAMTKLIWMAFLLVFLLNDSKAKLMLRRCKVEHLVGSLEYRCCWEVVDTTGKMAFDGSIEHIKCIIQHEDFLAITNKAVLTLAGQSLVRMDGSHYRKKKNVPEDE
jgi:hypothetical protein